jgi:hypothetical protein
MAGQQYMGIDYDGVACKLEHRLRNGLPVSAILIQQAIDAIRYLEELNDAQDKWLKEYQKKAESKVGEADPFT